MPLALYNLGVPIGIALNLGVIFVTHLSSRMYLALRQNVPDQPDSLYEIGYMTIGRGSIFFLSSVFLINAVGLCLIYFIVFGDTGAIMVASFVEDENYGTVWWTSRWPYTMFLAVILLPIVLMKDLAEFAWVSYVLFGTLGLFIVVNVIQLAFDSHFDALGLTTDILEPKIQWGTISALASVMVGYSYQ